MSGSEAYSRSEKQRTLLAELTEACRVSNINVLINPETSIPSGATLALDIEHDESGNFVGCGFLVVGSSDVCYYSDLSLLSRLDFRSFLIVAHNGKSDMECLRIWGIPVRDEQLIFDTELMAHILDSSRKGYGLKKLAKEDLGIEYPSYDDIVGKRTAKVRVTLDKQPIEIVSLYNALDCFVTMKLYEQQLKKSSGRELKFFNELEKPVSYVFQEMENRGTRVDLGYLQTLKIKLEDQKRPIEASIKNELGDINLNSPKQLLEALHAKEIYPELKGRPSTDKRAIAYYKDNPIIQRLLQFSELETLLSSFVYPYLERGETLVHPFFNQCGTRTGRPSCSNPNLLQIPKRTENGKLVRRMFIPRPGMLMGDCDFGQIEPRVLAHLSKDPVLCQMFNDGVDFHEYTATRLQISRERAKVLNLSVGYRATFKSVQTQLGGSREEAQTQIDRWWALFPTLRRWQDSLIYDSKRSAFCTTLLGRRIKVDGLTDGNSWKREAAERQLINNITQGSAAEIMKMAMIKISKDTRFSPSFGMLVQLYDELLAESPNMEADLNYMAEDMVTAVNLSVPLTVDSGIGKNWSDAH